MVAKARHEGADAEAGLFGIDFPGVYVKHKRFLPGAIETVQTVSRQRKWIKPEVSAAGNGKIESGESGHRGWKLPQLPGRGLKRVNAPLGVRNPLAIVMNREYAGIDAESFFDQDV